MKRCRSWTISVCCHPEPAAAFVEPTYFRISYPFAGHLSSRHADPRLGKRSEIDAQTLYQLERNHYDATDLRVNDWNDHAVGNSPSMDFIISLSGGIPRESHPEWPGDPMIANWNINDPLGTQGTEMARKTAFARALTELESRISISVNLPIASLDKLRLQQRLDEIGLNA